MVVEAAAAVEEAAVAVNSGEQSRMLWLKMGPVSSGLSRLVSALINYRVIYQVVNIRLIRAFRFIMVTLVLNQVYAYDDPVV